MKGANWFCGTTSWGKAPAASKRPHQTLRQGAQRGSGQGIAAAPAMTLAACALSMVEMVPPLLDVRQLLHPRSLLAALAALLPVCVTLLSAKRVLLSPNSAPPLPACEHRASTLCAPCHAARLPLSLQLHGSAWGCASAQGWADLQQQSTSGHLVV